MQQPLRAAVTPMAALLVLAACAGGPRAPGPAAGAAPAQASALAPALPERSPAAGFGLARDPALAAVLGDVSPERIRRADSALVAFGTRHIMSDTLSPARGTGAARRWLFAEMSAYARDCGGCLRVEFDTTSVVIERHPQRPTVRVVNVLAWLPGRDSSRVVVIGGHYDSCVCRSHSRWEAAADAPGANDDGSGTAAVLELARVFSRRFPRGLDATVIFALYDGEEIALLGSTHLAQRLHDGGYRVAAAFTDDIVGNVRGARGETDSTTVRIFAPDPDNGPSRELGRYVWAIGELYTPGFRVFPVFRLDRVGRGGDHSPFVRLGDAGLRFTEMVENENRQHGPEDTMDGVNFGYVANVVRLNAATVGALAMAPAPPDSVTARRELPTTGGRSWTLSWRPARGATAHEILLRRTWDAMPYAVIPVAAGSTTATIDVQLDNVWAAVRSVGAGGARSLAVVVPPPPRQVTNTR